MSFSSKKTEFPVRKSTGELEPYNRGKVLNSLLRTGIGKERAEKILRRAEAKFFPQISTFEIYEILKDELKKDFLLDFYHKYNLKKSLYKLGPTGYPFEKFVAKILQEYGYRTEVDVVFQGRCVQHEVDVVALKKGKFQLVECKFHNSPGIKTDVKVPLYIKARIDDILESPENFEIRKEKMGGGWIFTNTKFTKDAISYAECVGLRVTAWNYPKENSIQKIIEKKGLYPITILEEPEDLLSEALKQGIITIKDFLNMKEIAMRIFGEKYLKLRILVQGLVEYAK